MPENECSLNNSYLFFIRLMDKIVEKFISYTFII